MNPFKKKLFLSTLYSDFLLYVGLHDPHRMGGKTGEFGEKWGDGSPGMGTIPDWKPVWYTPEEVIVPPYLPDTPATRAEIAAQYTSISRMDAGNSGLKRPYHSSICYPNHLFK